MCPAYQGRFQYKKIYNEDPLEVARQIEDNGIKFIHLVDLEGAKIKRLKTLKFLKKLHGRQN